MGTVLNYREIDWITAPGDEYTLMNCPPPPGCSDELYLSSMWIQTVGTITVQETEPPGTGTVSAEEQKRIQQWTYQAVAKELCSALKQAEANLSMKLRATDFTLSESALRLMSATFKIRADRVTGTPPTTSPTPPKAPAA